MSPIKHADRKLRVTINIQRVLKNNESSASSTCKIRINCKVKKQMIVKTAETCQTRKAKWLSNHVIIEISGQKCVNTVY